MKVAVLDKNGKSVSEHILAKGISDYTPNEGAVRQYVRVFRSNQRQGTQSTKTRGEVAGSGAKPWAQKHTGRARAGEKRNPIWRHGGISHGPKPRSWRLQIPERLMSVVLKSVIVSKASKNRIFILEGLEMDKVSTKKAGEFIKKLGVRGKVLLVLEKPDQAVIKSFKNIPCVLTKVLPELCAYDILNSGSVLFMEKSLQKFEDKLKGGK